MGMNSSAPESSVDAGAVTHVPPHPALRGGEPVELIAADGVRLRGELLMPREPPRVAIVLSHAMMANRRSLDRPEGKGLLSALCRAGAAVLWMDLRGHGQSDLANSKGANWTYDDHVADAGLMAAELARRFPDVERVAVGHSLFGHAALAHQIRVTEGAIARGVAFDRFALLGVNVWTPALEPNRARWWTKRAVVAVLLGLTRLCGRFPARRLRMGSDDEALGFVQQMHEWTRSYWSDRAGHSFRTSMRLVKVPVLSIAGANDRLLSVPQCQQNFVAQLGGKVEHRVVGRATGYACDPGHMDLVLDLRMEKLWDEVAQFAVAGGRTEARGQ